MNESRMLWIWFWISQTFLFLNFCPPAMNFLIHCRSFQFPPHAHRQMIWNRWDRTWNVLFLSSTERSPVHKLIFKKNNAVKSTPFCCEKHKSGAIEYEFFDFDFPRMTSLFSIILRFFSLHWWDPPVTDTYHNYRIWLLKTWLLKTRWRPPSHHCIVFPSAPEWF